MSGRLVETIINRKMNSGSHSVNIDTEAMKLENGMYLVRMLGVGSMMTTKLIKN